MISYLLRGSPVPTNPALVDTDISQEIQIIVRAFVDCVEETRLLGYQVDNNIHERISRIHEFKEFKVHALYTLDGALFLI